MKSFLEGTQGEGAVTKRYGKRLPPMHAEKMLHRPPTRERGWPGAGEPVALPSTYLAPSVSQVIPPSTPRWEQLLNMNYSLHLAFVCLSLFTER